ncbi:MAG: sugar O-acyltransferase [Rubrivivax sp.]|nr:sugar O-acyltransferase [Rubrivivax sp.]
MDVVIFGLGTFARLAAFVLGRDSPHHPVAFTVHERFVTAEECDGLPVRRFEDLERSYPPDRVGLLAPIGWARMGGLRAEVLAAGKSRGYRFVSYVSSRALVWPGFDPRENVMIFDGAVVEPRAIVGENCIVRAGATLSHDVEIGDHCFVANGATICGRAAVGAQCFVGAGSTIVDGVRVAPRCFVAAGAVVTTDTQPEGLYRGNPARRSRIGIDRFEKPGR